MIINNRQATDIKQHDFNVLMFVKCWRRCHCRRRRLLLCWYFVAGRLVVSPLPARSDVCFITQLTLFLVRDKCRYLAREMISFYFNFSVGLLMFRNWHFTVADKCRDHCRSWPVEIFDFLSLLLMILLINAFNEPLSYITHLIKLVTTIIVATYTTKSLLSNWWRFVS